MKPLSFLLLFFFFIAPATPVMAEYLQGTVVRIDRDRGEVEIILSKTGQCPLENGNEEVDKGHSPQQEKEQIILVKAAWFPRCIAEGGQVYVRGEYAPNSKVVFEAEDIFSCRKRGGHDPTGVRSRFHHKRRQMMDQKGGEMHE